MRCLSCKYDLSHLTPGSDGEHRCPECGQAFDPNDISTFDWQYVLPRSFRQAGKAGAKRRDWIIAILIGLGLIIAWLAFVLSNTPIRGR